MITPGEYLSFVHYVERGDKNNAGRRIQHVALGLASEAGEMADLCKKEIVTGEPVDMSKAFDEGGDALYYLGILLNASGRTFEELMEWNMIKLRRRKAQGKDKAAEAEMLKEFLR
jgi:NTP pyrophosphatase (non-canonical NTP hydrolase)